MLLKLRIVFTILSALCLAALIPVGAFLDWTWAGVCALGAGLFFILMWLCKKKQEEKENENAEPPPDFFSPREKTDKND